MASSSKADMKGYYRQKKGSIAKKPTKSSAKASHSLGVSVTQPPPLSDEYDNVKEEDELVLRQFDMNMAYGPCLGMSRLARWERASKIGMNPPPDVERLLKLPQARIECLWEGRV